MTIKDAVEKQFAEEVALDAEGFPNVLTKDENRILRMKYGLSAVMLTPSEKYLINKEERKYGRN